MPSNHEQFHKEGNQPTPPNETELVRKRSILPLDLARKRSKKIQDETSVRPGMSESIDFWTRQVASIRNSAENSDEFDEIIGRFLADLEDQASIDTLTRLYSRGAIIEKTCELIAHTERTGEDLSMAILDLDKFKDTNDAYGHFVGDEILKNTGQHIMSSTRGGDIACRWGGEEIMEILPSTSLADAVEALERQRTTLPDRVHELLAKKNITMKKNTTTSIGIAAFKVQEYQTQFGSIQEQKDKILADEIDLEAVHSWAAALEAIRKRQIFDYHYVLADRALNAAKILGRNRTVVVLPDPDGDHLFVDMQTGFTYVENEWTRDGKTYREYDRINL